MSSQLKIRRATGLRRWLQAVVACIVLGTASASAGPAPPPASGGAVARLPAQDPGIGEARALEQRWALDAANAAREAAGLPPLHLDRSLTLAAQQHAADMAWHGYFSHLSPDGRTPRDRYVANGGDGSAQVAENIARCKTCGMRLTEQTVAQLTRDWLGSPEHRANLLAHGVDGFGFGTASDDELGLYAVQTFAATAPTPVAAAGSATPLLSPAAQTADVVERLDQARRERALRPLVANLALASAAARSLAASADGDTPAPDTGALICGVAAAEPSLWRRVAALSGRCTGCGAETTAADIDHFIGQWLADPAYRHELLDPALSDVGLALQADGRGGKVALLALGSRR